MAALERHRHELLARCIAQGLAPNASFEMAGYGATGGRHLLKRPEIQARIGELKQLAALSSVKTAAITTDVLISECQRVQKLAEERDQLSVALAAVREIGVLSGRRIERTEAGAPGEFRDVDTATLLAELRGLGITVEGLTIDVTPTNGAQQPVQGLDMSVPENVNSAPVLPEGVQQASPRETARAEAIRLLTEGHSLREVASKVGVSRGTVHNWSKAIPKRDILEPVLELQAKLEKVAGEIVEEENVLGGQDYNHDE